MERCHKFSIITHKSNSLKLLMYFPVDAIDQSSRQKTLTLAVLEALVQYCKWSLSAWWCPLKGGPFLTPGLRPKAGRGHFTLLPG